MRGSFVDGQAWFHDAGGLVAAYADTGNLLIATDPTLKAYGFIGEVGTGETLGTELLNGGDFEAGGTGDDFNGGAEIDDGTSDTFDPAVGAAWINQNVNDGNGDKVEATATAQAGSVAVMLTKTLAATVGIRSPNADFAVEPGKLYKISFYTRGDGSVQGSYLLYDRTNGAYIIVATATGVVGVVYTLVEHYFVAPAGCVAVDINFRLGDAGTVYFDSASIKEVTEPNANAVRIYKEHGLLNEGWNAIDTGIDYNAGADWDFDVYVNLMTATGSTAEARFEDGWLLVEPEGTNWLLGTEWNTGNGTDVSVADDDGYLRHDGATNDFAYVEGD